jgi:short-subunit dehydrogenase
MNEKEKFMNWDDLGTALITGASSGIGSEFARQLANHGLNLILVARRKNKLDELREKLVQEFSIKAEVLTADLSIPNDIDRISSKILGIKNLDVLINNAGFGIYKPFLEWEAKQSDEMISVHYTAPVRFCHAALKGMIKRGRGIIINNASSSAIIKSSPIYASSKAALVMFSEIIKQSIRAKDIHIQALCPGFTYSEFHDTDSMRGFDREDYSENVWMSAKEVVKLSLESIKSRHVIFIPGEENRELIKALRKATLKKYLNLRIL